MNEKTLHVLEYDKVLTRLEAFIASDVGHEWAKELRPFASFTDAERQLEMTEEAPVAEAAPAAEE